MKKCLTILSGPNPLFVTYYYKCYKIATLPHLRISTSRCESYQYIDLRTKKIYFCLFKWFWNVTTIFWRKNIFLSQYLFIAILFAKILCVNWALMDYFLMQQTSKLNSEILGLVKQTHCFSTHKRRVVFVK